MKITVLNGSPKGNLSVTLQYVHYIQKKFPGHELVIHNISQHINTLEKDRKAFDAVIADVRSSQGVIWATPVYYLVVPSQYKRFIELVFERKAEQAFKNKYAAVILTSIHFFDSAALNYLNAICDDLDMRFAGSFTPDMYDLMSSRTRKKLLIFADTYFNAADKKTVLTRAFEPLKHRGIAYKPGRAKHDIDATGKKIIVITDCDDPSTNIGKMIQYLRNSFTADIDVISIAEMGIKGGCTGCCRCGFDNICIYRDNFSSVFDARIKTADIIIIAGPIKDRYLSSTWKLFFDRSFYNGHIPVLSGKQFGAVISGPLRGLPNLRQIIEAMVELQESNLADIVTDEYETSPVIDSLLRGLAERVVQLSEMDYVKPASFLSFGGKKIFRDDIWSRLRFVFQKDHAFYKRRGMYDFPQKRYRLRLQVGIMMLLTKIPGLREEINKRIPAEMVKPIRKIVENT